ncbi:DUF4242 domain-containing protein [Solitalea lacus]|uniref:DUF4242 domain-containing protein n=1 Tax=Solitalea lacus TaxID=2911172 RepID=UPI001EDA155C|nr:DUF4242 domain-containing protein [Solitalea lacus]UKJ08506.1 DUF4242 domain-containing protein [Solitalea lacus]
MERVISVIHINSSLKFKPMKSLISLFAVFGLFFLACGANAKNVETDMDLAGIQDSNSNKAHYYIDVHNLEPGKVSLADVQDAHKKDLAAQGKYNVSFINFWVDEQQGKVYCLSKANDEESITSTHKEAHGLLPSAIYEVTEGQAAAMTGKKQLFIDVHELGPGKVTAKDVAGAHAKDLAVEGKYGVNFINYWVDEKNGVVFCLSEAANSTAIINTHKEAHGLVPAYIMKVKQGE